MLFDYSHQVFGMFIADVLDSKIINYKAELDALSALVDFTSRLNILWCSIDVPRFHSATECGHLHRTAQQCKWALHEVVLVMNNGVGTHFGCHV